MTSLVCPAIRGQSVSPQRAWTRSQCSGVMISSSTSRNQRILFLASSTCWQERPSEATQTPTTRLHHLFRSVHTLDDSVAIRSEDERPADKAQSDWCIHNVGGFPLCARTCDGKTLVVLSEAADVEAMPADERASWK